MGVEERGRCGPRSSVGQRVCDFVAREGGQTLGAGVAASAGGALALVAGVGLSIGDAEFEAEGDDFALPLIDKGSVEL